jgi:hypothetical protein
MIRTFGTVLVWLALVPAARAAGGDLERARDDRHLDAAAAHVAEQRERCGLNEDAMPVVPFIAVARVVGVRQRVPGAADAVVDHAGHSRARAAAVAGPVAAGVADPRNRGGRGHARRSGKEGGSELGGGVVASADIVCPSAARRWPIAVASTIRRTGQ